MPSFPLVLKVVLAGLAGLSVGRLLAMGAARLVESRVPPRLGRAAAITTAPSTSVVPDTRFVRAATGLAFAAVVARFGSWWDVGPYLALAGALIVLSIVDATTHRLPNSVVWPSIGVGVALVATFGGFPAGSSRFGPAVLGAALFATVIGAAHLVCPRGMGRGDVKLAVLLGLAIGWTQSTLSAAVVLVVDALVASSFLGIVQALKAGGFGDRRRPVPFGPALAAGSLVVIVVGPQLVP